MTVAHIGLGLFVLVAHDCCILYRRARRLARARRSTAVGAYQFRFDGVKPIEGPNYEGVAGTVVVTRNGEPVTVIYPEKRQYCVQHTTTTEAAIQHALRK